MTASTQRANVTPSKRRPLLAGTALLIAFSSPAVLATNGYFAHGYGVKSQGIAGIGVALPQDGLAAATNPAGTALVGNRVDLGITLFRPDRDSEVSGSPVPGFNGQYDGNETEYFLIPEIGYTRQLSAQHAIGVAVYGNGGMNTDYKNNPYAAFGSTGKANMNLEQLFITPSYAYKINADHAIGVGLNLVYQRFEIKGLGAFANPGYSVAPDKVTDNGTDSSTGYGLRLGWTGNISKDVTLGLAWSSRTEMGEFDDYAGLFAEGGDFDVPENYTAGIAWRTTPSLTLAADYQRILYSSVDSVGNPLANLLAGNRLGSDNGGGFGWEDISVYKIGGEYALNADITLRAGYSYADQPIPEDQTLFNIIAPGVVQNHLTLGATWQVGNGELSASYAHAFSETVKGDNSLAAFGGGEADLQMSEDMVGVAYAWKL